MTNNDPESSHVPCSVTVSPSAPLTYNVLLSSVTFSKLSELITVLSLDKMVASLRMGLNTPIPQGATCFGTKQRQILSLARSLKDHTPVILIDRSMSCLDLEQKVAILAYLKKYKITALILDDSLSHDDFDFAQIIEFD